MQQVLANGLIAGSTYALLAVSFAIPYRVARFFNFAHGASITYGAYVSWMLATWLRAPEPVAIGLALVVTALLAIGLDLLVFRRLRAGKAPALVPVIASLGSYIVLQNVISLTCGDLTRTLFRGVVTPGIDVLGARVTVLQTHMLWLTWGLVLLTALAARKTRHGLAFRGVSSDAELARLSGIDDGRIGTLSVAWGASLAAVAGILLAMDTDMVPTMGTNALLMGIVAAVLGGSGTVIGPALGGVALGLLQHSAVWFVGAQWENTIAFAILLLALVLRPRRRTPDSVVKDAR